MSQKLSSYRGLPTLAGLATLAEAARPGLSVEACVARLKRYHYAFLRLHEILTARITAEPIYELKTGFSHHAYLCAEHVAGPAHAHRRDARAAAGSGSRCRTPRWRSSSTKSWRRRRPASCSSASTRRRCPPSTPRWLAIRPTPIR